MSRIMAGGNFWKISFYLLIGLCFFAYNTNGDNCTVIAICPCDHDCISSVTNTSNVNLNCSYVNISNTTVHPEPPNNTIVFQMNYYCEGPKNDEAYSTGSVLTIIFFTFAFAYLGIGVAVNFFLLGARGVEVIPNLSFWKDFPSLVKDGAKYLQNGCTARPSELTTTTTAEGYDAI